MFGNYITVNCMSYKGSSVICIGVEERKQTNKQINVPFCFLHAAYNQLISVHVQKKEGNGGAYITVILIA